MTAGRAIVASDLPAIREVVGDTAILVRTPSEAAGPAGRRHAVAQRLDVVGVAGLAALLALLLLEARRLLVGVVDLGERVPELGAAHEELEPLDDRRIVVRRAGERGELDG